MFFFQAIVLAAAGFALSGVECSGVPALPAVAAAPVVEYAHAIPDNIPPYAAQVSVFRKALGPLIAAPALATLPAPYAARVAHLAPAAVPFTAPLAAPYVAGPAPVVPGPGVAVPAAYAALAAPGPYGWPGPAAAPYAAAAAVPAPYAAGAAFPAPYAAYSPYAAPAHLAPAPALVR